MFPLDDEACLKIKMAKQNNYHKNKLQNVEEIQLVSFNWFLKKFKHILSIQTAVYESH
jgi:hypothetical protein